MAIQFGTGLLEFIPLYFVDKRKTVICKWGTWSNDENSLFSRMELYTAIHVCVFVSSLVEIGWKVITPWSRMVQKLEFGNPFFGTT